MRINTQRQVERLTVARGIAQKTIAGALLVVTVSGIVACSPASATVPAAPNAATAPTAAAATSATPPAGMRQAGGPNQAGGQSLRVRLGIGGRNLTADLAKELGLTVTEGVYVAQSTADGPAAKAGVKAAATMTAPDPANRARPQGTPSAQAGGPAPQRTPGAQRGTPNAQNGATGAPGGAMPAPAKGGDVITAVDGQKVATVEGLGGYLDAKKSGDTVHLTVQRDGQTQQIDVTLGG